MDLSGQYIKGTGSYEVKEIAPPVESGQLLDNNNFVNWTAGAPDNFALGAAQDANNYLTQVSNGMYVYWQAGYYMYQLNVSTPAKFYKVTVKVTDYVQGSLRLYLTGGLNMYVSANGTYEFYTTCTSAVFYLQAGAAGTNEFVVEYVTIEEVPEGYPLLDKGDTYLEDTSLGTVGFASKQSFGTWEFTVYKGNAASNVAYEFMSNSMTPESNSYSIYILNNERLSFRRGSSLISYTAISYIQLATFYRVKVTRTLDGKFTFWIRGGQFGNDDWTSIVMEVGTNPTTDITYTTSDYFLFYGTAALQSRIANITMKNLVKQ